MTFDLSQPAGLMGALGPDIVLMVGAMALMLFAAWRPESDAHQRTVGYASIGIIGLTAVAIAVYVLRHAAASAPGGIIAVDGFRWAADGVFLLGAAATIALGIESNPRDRVYTAESHVLVLFATSGMMIMGAARDLMIVFLGVELMSIAVYVLAGINRGSEKSAEGALKYFLLGAFSTAFLLYGIALIYGATGTTNFAAIGERITRFQVAGHGMLLIGIGLLLVGFAFKVAAVPFHMWAPDVYEGAPTPITAYMAASVKAAAFAMFLRVWIEAFSILDVAWLSPVWWVAAATMLVGNLVALSQRNIKRMLAYSSIVHGGYLLVAVAAGTATGASAFLFYAVAYTLATFGAFAVVNVMSRPGTTGAAISDFDGLWTARPWLAAAFGVCMLALLGFPIFGGAGFFAKWYVLQAALTSPHPLIALSVVLVLTSVVSAGYYLHVVRVMFMRPRPDGAPEPARLTPLTRLVLVGSVSLLLILGLFPGSLATWARHHAVDTPLASRNPFVRVPID
ncbi:MAG TPA: NADH-quinone oxidoreductase subunit N [Gemmatimonadaceae bacterium]|nr:NADH-quinone oxidoreductase subunit N [Gemmatimonadaceae bacterium]